MIILLLLLPPLPLHLPLLLLLLDFSPARRTTVKQSFTPAGARANNKQAPLSGRLSPRQALRFGPRLRPRHDTMRIVS